MLQVSNGPIGTREVIDEAKDEVQPMRNTSELATIRKLSIFSSFLPSKVLHIIVKSYLIFCITYEFGLRAVVFSNWSLDFII
jgi:hypothetical protein